MLILSVIQKLLKVMKVLTQKYQDHTPCIFAYKLDCGDNKFTKPIVVFEVKIQLMNLLSNT